MGLFDSETKQKSKVRLTPWGPARAGLAQGAEAITDWMGQPQEFFPGQTYAGATPEQLAAIEQMKAAAGAAGDLIPAMTGGWMGALGRPEAVLGQGLQDVASNPYLAGIADVMERRSEERILEDVLPQMQAGAVGLGGLGGSRLAVNAQQAERDRQRALDEALAGLYGQAWQQGLGAETSRYNQALAGSTAALGQIPTILGALQTPAQQLYGAGGRERAEEQLGIDEAMARHQFGQMEPFNRAQMGMSALMGPAQAFGTTKGQTTTTSTPSPFSQIGSVIGAGAGLAGMMLGLPTMGMTGMTGGLGAMGGGMGPFSRGGESPFYGMQDPWGGPASMSMW